jgi:hypothetical protein
LNSAHKAIAAASLLLLAFVGVLVVALQCHRRSDAGLEPVTRTENAAPIVVNPVTVLEPITRTERSPAPVMMVKRGVSVSDYEARRRQLIANWGSTHATKSTVTREKQADEGTPASALQSTNGPPEVGRADAPDRAALATPTQGSDGMP